jgi:hypothetical protein
VKDVLSCSDKDTYCLVWDNCYFVAPFRNCCLEPVFIFSHPPIPVLSDGLHVVRWLYCYFMCCQKCVTGGAYHASDIACMKTVKCVSKSVQVREFHFKHSWPLLFLLQLMHSMAEIFAYSCTGNLLKVGRRKGKVGLIFLTGPSPPSKCSCESCMLN